MFNTEQEQGGSGLLAQRQISPPKARRGPDSTGTGFFGAAAPLPLGGGQGASLHPWCQDSVPILGIRHFTHCFQSQKIKRHFLILYLGPFLVATSKPWPREAGSRALHGATQGCTLQPETLRHSDELRALGCPPSSWRYALLHSQWWPDARSGGTLWSQPS